jgi:hypothetical protein
VTRITNDTKEELNELKKAANKQLSRIQGKLKQMTE